MCGRMVDIQSATSEEKKEEERRKTTVQKYNVRVCPHNMVNFGPLAAEIGLLVWGTPANFNGFRVLAALLHGRKRASAKLCGEVQGMALRNFRSRRHLYSAGWPSRWASAHIFSYDRPVE